MTLLSKSSWCNKLQFLYLGGNLGAEGVKALEVGQWEVLIVLGLKRRGVSSQAALTCLAQVCFPTLEQFNLAGNSFDYNVFVCCAVACLEPAQGRVSPPK